MEAAEALAVSECPSCTAMGIHFPIRCATELFGSARTSETHRLCSQQWHLISLLQWPFGTQKGTSRRTAIAPEQRVNPSALEALPLQFISPHSLLSSSIYCRGKCGRFNCAEPRGGGSWQQEGRISCSTAAE